MSYPFHISLPCRHIDATRKFYTHILGAKVGRSAQNWIDIDLHGHQLTFTNSGKFHFDYPKYSFEKTILPSFHFGVLLPEEIWQPLYDKMKSEEFVYIDETSFLQGKSGEHKSFFLRDPNGYIIEFKCFSNLETIFDS